VTICLTSSTVVCMSRGFSLASCPLSVCIYTAHRRQ